MAVKAGQVVIDITAGTSKFVVDMEKAKGTIKEFGNEAVGSHKAAVAAGKALEGQIFNNTRAADAFLINVLKLGPALKIAFPLLGGLAFAGMLADTGKKVYDFFKQLQEAPEKAKASFAGLLQPLKLTNDELDLTNIKLANQIARLEHKPENRAAQALAETKVEADKLAASLQTDIEKLEKVMMEQEVTFWQKAGGQAGNSDVVNWSKNLAKDLRELEAQGATPEQYKAKFEWYKTQANKGIIDAQKRSQPHQDVMKDSSGNVLAYGARWAGEDEAANLRSLNTFVTDLDREQSLIDKTGQHSKLATRLGDLEASKAASEAAKQAHEKELHGWEEGFAFLKSIQELSLSDELRFWKLKLSYVTDIGGAGADEYRNILERVGNYTQQIAKQNRERLKASDQEDLKQYENHIKDIGDAAIESGTSGAKARLAALQASDSSDSGQSADKIAYTLQAIEQAKLEVYKEETAELKKQIEQSQKLASIQVQANEQSGIAGNAGKRQALELAYASQRSHSFQEEIAYKKALAAIDQADLAIKLQGLQAEVVLDYMAGNYVKMSEDALKVRAMMLEIDTKRKVTEIDIASLEANHLTTLKSGLDAFIKESKDKAQEPGQILYEGLNSALDKTSDNLAKLFTGQKTKWKDEFKSIGEQMLQSQIKSSLQKAIGISGTPKGTANDPIYTKSAGGVPGVSSGSGGGGLFGGGSQGGGIFSLLKKVPFLSGLFSNGGAASAGSMAGGSEMDELASLTAMADGGDVSPGNLYKVNDRKDGQPEVFKPSQSGSIIPIDQLGTSGVSYHIDARGAALGVENRIFAGIKASHNQAVSNSVKANRQKQIRTPQRSGR